MAPVLLRLLTISALTASFTFLAAATTAAAADNSAASQQQQQEKHPQPQKPHQPQQKQHQRQQQQLHQRQQQQLHQRQQQQQQQRQQQHYQQSAVVLPLPILDLSPEGLDLLIDDLAAALGVPQLSPALNQPFTRLFSLVSDLLKAAEGLLIPPRSQEAATRLATSLRDIFIKQNIIKQKLKALQELTVDTALAPLERKSIKAIAEKLLQQYKDLETVGLTLLQQLADLLVSLFPHIKAPPPPAQEELKRQQEELSAAVKALFPNLLLD